MFFINDNNYDDDDEVDEVEGNENWAKYISFLSSKPPINHCWAHPSRPKNGSACPPYLEIIEICVFFQKTYFILPKNDTTVDSIHEGLVYTTVNTHI